MLIGKITGGVEGGVVPGGGTSISGGGGGGGGTGLMIPETLALVEAEAFIFAMPLGELAVLNPPIAKVVD